MNRLLCSISLSAFLIAPHASFASDDLSDLLNQRLAAAQTQKDTTAEQLSALQSEIVQEQAPASPMRGIGLNNKSCT